EDGDAGEDCFVSIDGLLSGIDEDLIGVLVSGPEGKGVVDQSLPRLVGRHSRGLGRTIARSWKNHFIGCAHGSGDGNADECRIGVVARVEVDQEVVPGEEVEWVPGERKNGRIAVGALELRETEEGRFATV